MLIGQNLLAQPMPTI